MKTADNIMVQHASSAMTAQPSDYWALLKPRVMTLVVFTGWIGMMLAPVSLHPVLLFTALLCIAVGAGAAAAFNMWYDRDIDQIMTRTQNRPLPRGVIAPPAVLEIFVTLSLFSVCLMGLALNWLAAGLLAFSIFFYTVIYTVWLKRLTAQNIVIGGAAGAFPPIIGWVAATGSLDVLPFLLFAITFFWTPPHFWALSLVRHGDYEKAKVPMLPVKIGDRRTVHHMLAYLAILFLVSVLPFFMGYAGVFYLGAALLCNVVFLVCGLRVYCALQGDDLANPKPAIAMFTFSLFYLFAVNLGLYFDRLLLG